MAGGPAKDLYEFLVESELEQYYNSLHNDLKIQTVSQIKYLEEDDLLDQGMSKPEIRRLMKYFRKYYPQGAFGKIRKIINTTLNKESDSDSRPTSPSVERAKPQPGGSGNLGSSKHIISSDAITLCKVLGKGEFGTVQQGVWTNDEGLKVQVAIKCLSKEKVNQGVAEFLKEASNMHSLDHDHIVRLYGVVLESDSLMLVTELAPLRSLLECLREPALRASFPVITLTDFAYQIADGMSYLENKRLIHRDLAARNVLVFTKDKVKISDFGLSRALGVGKDYYQTNFNVNLKLPIAWCAPESINYLKFTSASDVWAYAVTLWEMFSYGFQPWAALTGEQTLADLSSGELVQLKQKILGAIDEPNCQRLEMPDACPMEYYKIMLKCWEHNPKDRPTFAEILRILPQIKPEQVQAIVDSSHNTRVEFLHHRTQDIITVLDKKPDNPPILGAWRGITENGKTGLFDSKEVQPFIQIKTVNPRLRSIKVSRSDSSRKSMSQKRKLRADMISRPQNDLRHTGHIGYDGAVFGDVSFIGDNYDKLPYKVVTPYKPQDDLMTSSTTSSIDGEGKMFGGQSQLSLTTSVYSASSAGSGDTLTEVSSLDERTTNGKSYQDEDFTDFKIPDLSSSLGLDLDIGTSFMDEVMKKFESSSFSFEENSFAGEMSPDSKPKSKQSPTGNGLPSGTSWNNDEISSNVEEKKSDHNGWKPKLKLEEDQSSNMPQKVVAPSKRNEQEVEQEEEEEETDEEVTDEEETEESESEAEENITKEKKPQIKTMSSTEEKRMEEAIAKVNEFAQLRERAAELDEVDGPQPEDTAAASQSHGKLFGFIKRSPSPQQEKKTFTDEIERRKNGMSEEDVSTEGQEAYNILVAKGVQGEKKDERVKSVDAREKRIRRALQHQQADAKRNANFREPQGIPFRRSSQEGLLDDLNPLRRLRESVTVGPRASARPLSDDIENKRNSSGSNSSIPSSRSNDSIRNPHLVSESGFLARFRDQDTDSSRDSNASDSPPVREKKIPPVPPRKPLRPGTINSKPRERKYQLDMTDPNDTNNNSNGDLTNGESSKDSDKDFNDSKDSDESSVEPSKATSQQLNSTNANPNVNPNANQNAIPNATYANEALTEPVEATDTQAQPTFPKLFKTSQFCVKLIRDSAQDLGLSDTDDQFWKSEVDFSEIAPPDEEGETTPTTFRYKTENASYEELLDFALDSDEKNKGAAKKPRPRSTESQECDEIRLMKRVLTKDVTVEDCMIALQETHWQVHNAIKFLKLKQLLSLKVADSDACKQALQTFLWDSQEAAAYLIANPKDQESPECVNI